MLMLCLADAKRFQDERGRRDDLEGGRLRSFPRAALPKKEACAERVTCVLSLIHI